MIATAQKKDAAQHARSERDGLEKRRWTADEYLKMAELGILASGERLELIDGEIYKKMSPVGLPHYWCVNRLNRLFHTKLLNSVIVSVQNPLWLDEHNEPEPDVVLLPMMDMHVRPGAKDALLVVEVSDSTLDLDRKVKLPLYAKFEVGEVWLVNLAEACLEVYREPKDEGYGQMKKYEANESVSAMQFPDVKFSVAEILGMNH
ncbi:MAG: Uma2 family endonuclease [Chloroherpetonaceae bacterium]